MTNPILKELHDIRDDILAEHKDDLADYLRTGLAQTKASGHPIAKVKQRTSKALTSRVFEPKFKALVQEARLKRAGG